MNIDYEENYELSLEDMGYTHETELPDLSHARDFMGGVLEALYETGDTSRLEECLEEVCHILDMKLEAKELKVESIEKQQIRLKNMENSGNKHHSFEIDKIITSLIKAQAEIEPAKATKVNSHFRNKYSTLADCFNACRAPLLENGIATMQYCETIDGKLFLITMLAHTSGQWMKSVYPIISKDQTSQSIGSAVTYAKRYSLCAMVGIVTDEENKKDDDGESALGRNKYLNTAKPISKIESMPEEQEQKSITKEQYIKLEELLKDNPDLRKNLLGYMKAQYSLDSLEKMPLKLYVKAIERATTKVQGAN